MEGANEDTPSAEPVPKVKKTRKRKVIAEESTIPDDSEDVATATAEGPKKKPRSTGASGKTATTALLEHLLPLQYYHLLLFFDLCDKMYCFLSKMNMKSSTENLTRMYGNLVSFSVLNDLEAWREFHPQNLVAVCSFCPSDFLLNDFQVSKEELRLEGGPVTATESRTLLEFTFKRFLGIGKGNIDKRRKLLLQAMTRYVIEHFLRSEAASESFANVSHGEVIASINENGWPETFDVHSCPLPDDKVINEQASLRKARQLLGLGSPLTQKDSLLSKVEQGNSRDDSTPPVGTRVCDDGFYENCAGALTYALAEIRKAAFYRGQIRHVRYFPSQRAVFGRLERPLPSVLQQRITDLYNIRHFYRHQAIAINAIRDGRHVMISTSTASGKSLVFNLPVVEQLLLDRDRGIASTALYLFPTKALAQDQLRSLRQFLGPQLVTQVVPVVCDGDTPHGDRMDVMHGLGDIILTNPDMLHHTLLPEHKAWQRIFAHLRYIVLDEAHLYSGSFGTHVACVMRRVIRVCLAYNATSLPQFICCSATISNPLEHICSLLPLRVLPSPSRVERTTPTTAVEVAVETEGAGAGAGAGSAGGATSDAHDHNGGSPPLASDSNDIDDVEEKEETIDDDDVEHAVLPAQVLWDDLNLAIVDHTMDGAPHGERAFVIWNPHGLEEAAAAAAAANANAAATKATVVDGQAALPVSDDDLRELLTASDELLPSLAALPYDEDGQLLPQPTSRTAATTTTTAKTNPTANPATVGANSLSPPSASSLSRPPRTGEGLDEKLLRTMSGGSRHVSIIFETAVLFAALITQRLRTIAFCKTRKLVELVYKYCVRELERSGGEHAALVPSVSSYRGGYTDEERRSIERELFAHRLLGVAATCALELGIDVGSLDVTMHMGFPGSFSSLWQQAGRAGRSGRASLSFIMCFECPVDQYFARFPEKLLSKDAIEPAVLDVDNLLILKSHVACAAKEIPLNFDFQYVTSSSSSTATLATTLLSDHQLWGVNYGPAVDVLLEHYTLRPMRTKATGTLVTTSRFVNKGRNTATHSSATVAATATADANNESNRQGQPLLMYWSSGSYAKNEAARQVNLRMIDPITISIVDDTQPAGSPRRTIDSMEYSRAFFELFENAIFLHRGQQFLVRHLDLAAHVAYTVPVKVKYITSARNATIITVIKDVESFPKAKPTTTTTTAAAGAAGTAAVVPGAAVGTATAGDGRRRDGNDGEVDDDGGDGDSVDDSFVFDPHRHDNNVTGWSQVDQRRRRYLERRKLSLTEKIRRWQGQRQPMAHRLQQTTGTWPSQQQKSTSRHATEAETAVPVSETTTTATSLVHYGVVQVVHRVFGYVKQWLRNGEIFEVGECSLPPLEYETTAVWVDLPVKLKHTLDRDLGICSIASMHAANHILLQCGALIGQSGCDVSDLGTEHDLSAEVRADTHPFRMLLYDKRPGGLGACANIFLCMQQVLQAAMDIVRHCPCRYGCPSCILDCRCTAYNRRVNKRGALFLLESIAALIGMRSSSPPSAVSVTNNVDAGAATSSLLQCQPCQPVAGDEEIDAVEAAAAAEARTAAVAAADAGATAVVDRCCRSSSRATTVTVAPDDVLDFSDDDNDNDNENGVAVAGANAQPMAPVPIYANPKPSGSVRINAHTSDDFDDDLPAAITSFDDDWWSPLPPSAPPTATSATAAEPASAAPPPQPAPLAHDHVKKLLATISPTKQQRHLSLNKATIRDSVRSRGLAIQSKWTDAVPDFITDSHHQHPPHP